MYHLKKKIWIFLVIALFFLAAGFWYLQKGQETGQQKETGLQEITRLQDEAKQQDEAELQDEAEQQETGSALVSQTPEQPMIFVYVCGAVVSPGVYEMPKGSRLFEAISLAGGCLPEADEDYHNLARTVSDGERVYILSAEESTLLSAEERVSGEETPQPAGEAQAGETKEELINLNTATVKELTALPGIGESRAESIIEYRTKVGAFRGIEEIMNISGIGEAMFEKIKDRISVE